MAETTAVPVSETLRCERGAHIFVDSANRCQCGEMPRHLPPNVTLTGSVTLLPPGSAIPPEETPPRTLREPLANTQAGRFDRRRTDYALSFDLLKVGEWIARHALPGENVTPMLDQITRAVNILRGAVGDAPHDLDELLRNDPWAAAIASRVRAHDRDSRPRDQEDAESTLSDVLARERFLEERVRELEAQLRERSNA